MNADAVGADLAVDTIDRGGLTFLDGAQAALGGLRRIDRIVLAGDDQAAVVGIVDDFNVPGAPAGWSEEITEGRT